MPAGLSRSERSWVLYDVANSAYSLAVTTAVFPLFFKTQIAADAPDATSTAYLAFANSLFTLVVAVLATALGPMGDYQGRKKRFFASFFALGVAATGAIAVAATGRPLAALALYVVSGIGFAGANVFYDAFLTDVTTPERMDRVSAAGYAWGYVGGSLPFVLALGVMVVLPQAGVTIGGSGMRIAFVIAAVWWLLFTVPLLRHVRQVHYLPLAGRSAAGAIRDSLRRVMSVVRQIRRYRKVMLFLLAYFFYIDGVGAVIRLATAYGTDIGLPAGTVLAVLLAVQVVAFPCTLLYGKLAALTSPRTMLLAGIGVYVVVTALAFVIPRLPAAAQAPTFWGIALLVGTSQGGIQALSRSYYAQMIPADSAAEFFGFYNIFGKFAAILGPLLVGVFAQLTGDTSIGVLSLVVLFVIGGALLLRVPAEPEPVRPARDPGRPAGAA